MNSIVDACLKSINDINENEFIAEMNAFDALLENYNKMLCLMEYDTSRVFVEAEVAQNPPAQNTQPAAQPAQADNTQQQTATTKTDNGEKKSAWEFNPRPDKKDGSGKENIIISILFFIPRLIAACVKFIINSIKNLFSGKNKTEQAMNNVTQQLNRAPDPFRKWIIHNEDGLAKLMEEASGQTNWAMHFRISPVRFENSAKVATGEKGLFGDKYEIIVYPPIGTATIENNLKSYTTEILDPLIKELNNLFVHKTNDERQQEVYQLTAKTVNDLKHRIDVFYAKLKKQNEIATNVKKIQDSTKKLIVDVPEYQGEKKLTTMNYSMTPKDLYTKLGELSQIAQVMGKRNDTIEKLLQDYQKNPGTMAPDSPETLTAFKEAISELKNVTSDTILQIRFISDLATNLPKELELTAQGIPQMIQKWVQSNGGNAEETAETTEAETKTEEQTGESGENVNNDAAAEGAEQKPGFFNRMGTAISNTAANVKNKVADLNTQRIVAGNEKAYQSFTEKYGKSAPAELQVMYPGTKEFTKLGEAPEVYKLHELINKTNEDRPGSKIRIIRKPDGVNEYYFIDENNEKIFITEQDLEGFQDNIEIITEQDYLMYYQFENISSLEF